MICKFKIAFWVLSMSVMALIPGTAGAQRHDCPNPLLHVLTETEQIADLACTAAMAAKTLLESCGLVQQAPITIEVVASAMHPSMGACVALYDLQTGCLQVTELDRLAALLPPDDARSRLPPEAVFAAAIAHEMAHAMVQQSSLGAPVAATEQEFIANAIEMESYDPDQRAILLAADPVNPNGSLSLVHLSIYGLAPRSFANNAWIVFNQESMGCSLVQSIIAGRFRFPRR